MYREADPAPPTGTKFTIDRVDPYDGGSYLLRFVNDPVLREGDQINDSNYAHGVSGPDGCWVVSAVHRLGGPHNIRSGWYVVVPLSRPCIGEATVERQPSKFVGVVSNTGGVAGFTVGR